MDRPTSIRVLDPPAADPQRNVSDAVILTRDCRILMQQRPANWGRSAGKLTSFGGHIDPGETAIQAVIRELHEEVGAIVGAGDLVGLGALTEAETGHTEIVHAWFWHDTQGTITGCYECEAAYYDRIEGALAHPMIMDCHRWMLLECRERGLLG